MIFEHFFNHLLQFQNNGYTILNYLEFEEILSSSVGALALLFRWNKIEKSEFTEIASGMLYSSYVYGYPIATIG